MCRWRLVIDSRGWGHDTDLIVSHGPALLEADPHNNIIFSTHQYRDAASAGQSYWDSTFKQLAESGLAVVIGEFGNSTTDCNVATDYRALIAAANTHQLGWYAWSWGPGNTPCDVLDMTQDGNYSTLHGWGLEVASTHADSIENTSKPVRVSDADAGACQ